jgi:hypothetical protein
MDARRERAEREARLARSMTNLREAETALATGRADEALRLAGAIEEVARRSSGPAERQPLARARLVAAAAHRALGAQDAEVLALGRTCVAGYPGSEEVPGPDSEAAAQALERLADIRGAAPELERAAAEVLIRRFPESPLVGRARLRRARYLAAHGFQQDALEDLEAALSAGTPGPEESAGAEELRRFLAALRPARLASFPPGEPAAGDHRELGPLDGMDGERHDLGPAGTRAQDALEIGPAARRARAAVSS